MTGGVLVDTPLWSLAYRRKTGLLNGPEAEAVADLTALVVARRAKVIGPIRQECLSGIRETPSFERLRDILRAFEDEHLQTGDYETAAQLGNLCRSAGIAATSIDMLICAAAIRRRWRVFTTDRDFEHYARVLPLMLHK